MSQLCAAEGKFRQLNAIKEGLDMQLVKQAHFLLLIGRDLHSDIGKCMRVMLQMIVCGMQVLLYDCVFVE